MAAITPLGRCARHPDSPAVAVCPRCGDHDCDACWDREDALCVSCRVEHGGHRLAYESTRLGLGSTVLEILREPKKVFARMPMRGRPLRSLEVAALAWSAPCVALVLLGKLRAGDTRWDWLELLVFVEIAAVGALIGVIAAAMHAGMLWATSRLWSPRSASAAVRAAGYGQCAVAVIAIALLASAFVPRGADALLLLIALAAYAQHQANAFGLFLRGRDAPPVAPRVAGALISVGSIAVLVALSLARQQS